jgi:acyl carrier protein
VRLVRDDARDAVHAALRDWLARANPAASTARVNPDTDIIESGIIDSLQVVEFILFLEELTGRAILAEDLDPDTLRTLDAIYACYFETAP